MAHLLRTSLHTFVPSHFHDFWGLAFRVIRSRNPAARFAMQNALLGLLLTPLDLLLSIAEMQLYKKASKSKLPLIFVCGAPRSGTTLITQVLIAHLPVCYINNITAVFPRSPIVANLLFGKPQGQKALDYSSYYGKTLHFSGPNDALYIWDRWFGTDRTRIPSALSLSDQEQIIRFFGAYEQVFQRPVLNKNNSLDTCASLIAAVLENSYFLCMTRDPLYLAQSLLRARTDIHGDVQTPYGVTNSSNPTVRRKDYIEDVCEQVLFHEEKMREQQRIIGAERFWIVSYEEFCAAPYKLLARVSEHILRQPLQTEQIAKSLQPFDNSNKIRLDRELFANIERTLVRLNKRKPKQKKSE
jgi:LPS sulfotransferase NodH